MVIVECQSNLLEVVTALSPARGFSHLLHSGQEQRRQNCNDRNDNQ